MRLVSIEHAAKKPSAKEMVHDAFSGFLSFSQLQELKATTRLKEDLGWDASNIARLREFLRDEFKLRLEAAKLKACKTYGDVVKLVEGGDAVEVDPPVFGMPRAKFVQLISRWYGESGNQTKWRDDLLQIKFPPEFRQVKSKYLYRFIHLPKSKAVALATGKSITLKSFKTSSWTTARNYLLESSAPGDLQGKGWVTVVVKKAVKPKDILVNSPLLLRKLRWLEKALNAVDDVSVGSISSEQEVIVRNSLYWLTIKPEDVVVIDGSKPKEWLA